MTSVIFSREYTVPPRLLLEQRRRAGLSQRCVAQRMRRSQSHVYNRETGQRRIELIEFCPHVEAAGGDPAAAFAELLGRLTGGAPADEDTAAA